MFFEVEIQAFQELLPLLDSHAEKCGLAIFKRPICHYGSYEKGIIVMENLKTSGFEMLTFANGLNVRVVEMVLEQLALLHATSYSWIKTIGFEKFQNDYSELIHDSKYFKDFFPTLNIIPRLVSEK